LKAETFQISHFTSQATMDTLPTTQDKIVPDAYDCKGFPAERSKTGGWTSASMILGLTN